MQIFRLKKILQSFLISGEFVDKLDMSLLKNIGKVNFVSYGFFKACKANVIKTAEKHVWLHTQFKAFGRMF